MIRTTAATLYTLPVEILHQIFDDLDGTTLLLSVQNVCQRFRAAVNTHHRYELDLTVTSQCRFHQLLVLIHPERVTGLTLTDRGTTPGQIGIFLSLIDIGLFTQLRSLTLLEINGQDLCPFLEHAKTCSLISLTLDSTFCNTEEHQLISQHLASIIGQSTLLRLRLLSTDLCMLIDRLEWPVQCKLHYLTMRFFKKNQVAEILLRAPDLQTLDLGTTMGYTFHDYNDAADISFALHSQLTSLIISSRQQSLEVILPLLSSTPCLRHLKIVHTVVELLAGFRWEEFIKLKLATLSKFEFYTTSHLRRSEEETEESTLIWLTASFRTPFWTEEKRWSVTCNWFLTQEIVEIYTSPICTSKYHHYADTNMHTVSNFATEDRQSMISKDVHQLSVALRSRDLVEHRVSCRNGSCRSLSQIIP